MKISIILGAYSVGQRPLDFNNYNIWQSKRGLTGTDLAAIMVSLCLAQAGHDVSFFSVYANYKDKPKIWENIKLYFLEEMRSTIDNSFDAIISINEPDMLRGIPAGPLKICWQFLNDFNYCMPGFINNVDIFLGVCDKHSKYLQKQISEDTKWHSIGLGCAPEWYQDNRVPGKVVWCSSADRGLHWLLQEWPKIRAAVPYATLKIFYHFNFEHVEAIEPTSNNHSPLIKEMANRIRYIKNAIKLLNPLGVEHIGSTSRDQMKQELSEASVFAYSCDTLNFSEGFSVSTLEAHASSTVPIITDVDCLGDVYEKSGAIIIKNPIKNNLSQFTDAIIKSLLDKQFADDIIYKCKEFAEQNTWKKVSEKIVDLIKLERKQ